MRRLLRKARREVLVIMVASAAIPVAAAVGSAALVVGAVRRTIPRRREELLPRSGRWLASIQILNYEGKELLERNLPSVLAAVAATGEE